MSATMSGHNRFCRFVLYLHLFWACCIASVICQYEATEEELVQPNRIDEVSSHFVCSNEGYFADVTYGCQFYHVCENANSPYDKPSFVKHTFSCVNGTVFNQMSFTCTRYQDSIPCEASPNYFYLNKRNGDPKAYFLTEEDIIKPSNGPKHLSSSTLGTLSQVTSKPVLFSRSAIATSSPVASSPKPVAVLQKSLDIPLESTVNYGPIDNDYESNSVSEEKAYSGRASAPYEVSSKYSTGSKFKPGVRYSKSKYEPVRKSLGVDIPPPSYITENRPEDNLHIRSEPSEQVNKPSYHSMITSFKPVNSKIDQMLSSYEYIDSNSKDSFSYNRPNESSKLSPISIIAPPKKTPFTPAAFSKMYIENQKASKYSHDMKSAIVPPPSSVHTFSKPHSEIAEPYFPRQKLVESQPKIGSYSSFSKAVVSSSKGPVLSTSKYEPTEISANHNLIKTNQFTATPSIRVIEPDNGKLLDQLNRETESSLNEPVKMSFVNKQDNSQSSVADFGNLRVVKQVKGKNLLIDPSLENDPARDNIIAQVLEMLNKYN